MIIAKIKFGMKWKRAILITLKILAGTIGSLLFLLIVFILLIRLPSVQTYITHKAVAYLSKKTHTKIALKGLWISFPKSVVIDQLYAEDVNHDTLAYIGKLNVDIDMLALLKRKIKVNHLFLSDVNANIARSKVDSTFNFNFFIKAFSSGEKKAPVVKVKTNPKDTVGWQIQVNKLQLENIRGSYADGVSGLTIKATVGNLDLNMKAIDIKHLSFSGHDLALSNVNFTLIQSQSNPSVEDTSVALLPLIAMDKLTLKNIKFLYKNIPHNQSYAIHVDTLSAIPGAIDLNGHNIHVKSVYLAESDGQISLQRNFTKETSSATKVEIDTSIGWQVSGDSVTLHKVDFNYDLSNVPKIESGFDYNHIGLKNVSLLAGKVSYSTKKIVATVHSLSLKEQSGFDLKNLSLAGIFDYKSVIVKHLMLTTSYSVINNVSARISALDKIAHNIGALGIEANLTPLQIGLDDLYLFAPSLRKSLPQVDGNQLSVSGKISGRLDNITATNLMASAGANTKISLNGHITGLPNALGANYDVDIKNAQSTRDDLNRFLKNTLPVSISIPPDFSVSGQVKGSIENATADLILQSSYGNIDINAALKITEQDTQYSAKINLMNVNVGHILKDTSLLGKVTGTVTAQGRNFALNNIVADATVLIDSISFKQYTYNCLTVDACADQGEYNANVSINDPNVLADIDAAFSFAPKIIHMELSGNIEGINMQKTRLYNQDLRVAARLNANVTDSDGNINGIVNIAKLLVIKDEDKYQVDSINLFAITDSGFSHFNIKSDLVDADYKGTSKVQDLGKTLLSYINGYFPLPGIKDSNIVSTDAQKFKLDVTVYPHPLITEVLLPQMKGFNGAEVKGDFDNDKHQLNIDLSASALAYSSIKANVVNGSIHSVNDSLKYDFSFQDMSAGPVKLSQTDLSGFLKEGVISFLLDVKDSLGGDKLKIAGNLKEPEPKNYALHIEAKDLKINNSIWNLKDDNLVRLQPDGINVRNFVLNNSDQSISIKSQTEEGNAPIDLQFDNFHLGTISQIIESDSALVRGHMNGTVELRNLGTHPAFTSDLSIDSIAYDEHPIGNIKLKANNLTEDKYEADLTLSGAGNQVEINGSYTASEEESKLAMKANIHKLTVQSIEPFTVGQIRRSKGYLSGTADITGAAAHPQINADLAFTDAAFNVAYLNNYISLNNDHIKVDPKGIYFNSFTILDTFGQKATIDGSIATTDFRKMKFALSIQTNKFTALNTKIEDNPLYFGRVMFSSQIKVKGDQLMPIVNGNIKLLDATNLSVVIPSSRISLDRGDGVVVMVSHTDTNAIMYHKDTIANKLEFKGISVQANVEIEKKATFKVIVDKSSGDSLVVHGEGKLSFSMDASGNQNLTGTYTLTGGSYDATFQHVIHKHFAIKDGSSITWNGQPEDAVLDVTAVYPVKAAPSDLVSTEISGLSDADKAGYNKPLGFDVYLTVKGELLKPDISFKLDMDDRDKAAFSGLVYSKVNSVNDDPSELNSQVFSLLILGKFMPTGTGGSTDYGSVATDLARNSVNQILQDQLNSLSGKYIKGVDLNFGVQSNDEYTATGINQNTQLSVALKKQFLNDRLGVQVGTSVNVPNSGGAASSYNSNSITGNFQIDYKLTPDGRFLFKVFCLNEYEGFIEGLVYKTGVGVVYTKNYNTLRELFEKPIKKAESSKPKALIP
jgi:hypothetical protein